AWVNLPTLKSITTRQRRRRWKKRRVFDLLLRAGRFAGTQVCSSTSQHRGLIARKGRSLVELGSDLSLQLPGRPSASPCLGLVEGARFEVLHAHQPDVVRPGQREWRASADRRFRRRRVLNWPAQVKEPHLLQVALGEAATEPGRLVRGQTRQ